MSLNDENFFKQETLYFEKLLQSSDPAVVQYFIEKFSAEKNKLKDVQEFDEIESMDFDEAYVDENDIIESEMNERAVLPERFDDSKFYFNLKVVLKKKYKVLVVYNLLVLIIISLYFRYKKYFYLGSFEFVKNELFEFLNENENIDGNIILGRYKNKNVLERGRLKRLLIHTEMRKDLIKYKYELI